MEKDVKYLNYEVYHDGVLSHQGTVPGLMALSGVEKQFNLGGVWLWHTSPVRVRLKLWNEVASADNYSDRTPTTWINYAHDHGIPIANPHDGRV